MCEVMMMNRDEELKNRIIRMDNILATKSTRLDVAHQKLFYIALASINPLQEDNEVVINKSYLFDYLGLKSENKHTGLKEMFRKLAPKTWIEFEDEDGNWDSGFLISGVRSTRKNIIVRFDSYYLPLLTHLSTNFTRLLSDDVVEFNSKFSMMLYQFLMRYNDNTKTMGPITLSTKQLKKLFGLGDEDYCRKNGKFDRVSFEKKTLNVAIQEINEKAECISNLSYIKIYEHRKVKCYEFQYKTHDPQKIADEKNQTELISQVKQAREKISENEPPEGQETIFDYGIEEPKKVKPSHYEWWNDLEEK